MRADKHDAALAMFQTKPDHDEPCGMCNGGATADAASWPEPHWPQNLDVLDRTAEVARGTR